ncbi:MAG: ThiF family adenylyltransferase [Rikenellaceae bacterium]
MNLLRSYEFFQPEECRERIHIIGCGAIGSTLAENLIRLGLTKISIYDFDKVESHNIANQMYRQIDIKKEKVDALFEMLSDINPEIKDIENGFKIVRKGYTDQKLSGYVFLCVDSIELRKEICESNKFNTCIKAVFDFRMRLTDAQHFAADWRDKKMVANLIKTMQFSHEEALADTPVSACNSPLSVAPTIRSIVAYGVSNFMNFVKGKSLKTLIVTYPFDYVVDAF